MVGTKQGICESSARRNWRRLNGGQEHAGADGRKGRAIVWGSEGRECEAVGHSRCSEDPLKRRSRNDVGQMEYA